MRFGRYPVNAIHLDRKYSEQKNHLPMDYLFLKSTFEYSFTNKIFINATKSNINEINNLLSEIKLNYTA